MNIELMMKAVNYLNGCLSNTYMPHPTDRYLFIDNNTGSYITHYDEDDEKGVYTMICTIKEFNQLIAELSNWQPTLPKVEAVEVDGMIYEIGKLYKFKDIAAKDAVIGILRRVDGNSGRSNFLAETNDTCDWFQECKKITYEVGTITPAPVKLIDGCTYMFTFLGEVRLGFKHGNYFIVDRDTSLSINLCTNITRLVPEGK